MTRDEGVFTVFGRNGVMPGQTGSDQKERKQGRTGMRYVSSDLVHPCNPASLHAAQWLLTIACWDGSRHTDADDIYSPGSVQFRTGSTNLLSDVSQSNLVFSIMTTHAFIDNWLNDVGPTEFFSWHDHKSYQDLLQCFQHVFLIHTSLWLSLIFWKQW